MLPHYALADHRVVKVYEVIDIANCTRIESELFPLIRGCPSPGIVIDLRAPLLTSTGIDLLMTGRDLAVERELSWSVAAHHPATRRVARLTGTTTELSLSADLAGALRAAPWPGAPGERGA
ncbi:STAS domain-containing protein [Streptomyces sp. NBC_01304]|uniref:STAS domain-containing protein n=1 Tax=Streptomyces sp. NBC_01304 TaxID=2903818 RepID=UPI002E0EF55E|nr:STAS domain-containing protein [Streptomyces sp. NBC_01304]